MVKLGACRNNNSRAQNWSNAGLDTTYVARGSPSAVVNGAAGLVVAALVILGLYEGRDLLIPLAIAAILSFILFPLVRRLTNWGFPTGSRGNTCYERPRGDSARQPHFGRTRGRLSSRRDTAP